MRKWFQSHLQEVLFDVHMQLEKYFLFSLRVPLETDWGESSSQARTRSE